MQHDDLKSLSNVRMEHAEECLSSAKTMLSADDYKGAANRSYYAVFHAMRSVLAFDGIDMKRHSGVISEFRRLYIKTGVFESGLSDIIGSLFDVRVDSDYNDFFVISKSEVSAQIENAQVFLDAVKAFLQTK